MEDGEAQLRQDPFTLRVIHQYTLNKQKAPESLDDLKQSGLRSRDSPRSHDRQGRLEAGYGRCTQRWGSAGTGHLGRAQSFESRGQRWNGLKHLVRRSNFGPKLFRLAIPAHLAFGPLLCYGRGRDHDFALTGVALCQG